MLRYTFIACLVCIYYQLYSIVSLYVNTLKAVCKLYATQYVLKLGPMLLVFAFNHLLNFITSGYDMYAFGEHLAVENIISY
jgi:hypothetical protein